MFRHVAGFALRLTGAYQDAGAYGACPWAPMPKDEDPGAGISVLFLLTKSEIEDGPACW